MPTSQIKNSKTYATQIKKATKSFKINPGKPDFSGYKKKFKKFQKNA
jgi:hypothetical protein